MISSLLRLPPAVRQQIWATCAATGAGNCISRPLNSGRPHCNTHDTLPSRRGYATVYTPQEVSSWNETNRNKSSTGNQALSDQSIDKLLEATRAALDSHTSISELEKGEVISEVRYMIKDRALQNEYPTRRAIRERFSDDYVVGAVRHALLARKPAAGAGSEAAAQEKDHELDPSSSVVAEELLSKAQECLKSLAENNPGAPAEFFGPTWKTSELEIHASLERLQSDAARLERPIKITTSKSSHGPAETKTQICTFQVSVSKQNTFVVKGQDPSNPGALFSAYAKLFSRLDSRGVLRDMYSAPDKDLYPGGNVPQVGVAADTFHVTNVLRLPSKTHYSISALTSGKSSANSGTPHLITKIRAACWRQGLPTDLEWHTTNFIRSDFVGCKLVISMPGVASVTVVGEGEDIRAASTSAQLHLLAKLHADGSFQRIFGADILEKPKPQQYPHAPKALFSPTTVSGEIHNLAQRFGTSLYVNTSKNIIERGTLHTCDLEAELPGHFALSAKGVGTNDSAAKQDAWMNVLAELHENSILATLYPDPSSTALHERASPEIIASATGHEELERDSQDKRNVQVTEIVGLSKETMQATPKTKPTTKVEIYNFAASLGLVPNFDTKVAPPRTLRAKRNSKSKKSGPRVVVSIRIPELDIAVHGLGEDVRAAEADAAVKFMAEARTDDSTPPKDHRFQVLSADTGKQFFDFLRVSGKGANLEVEHEPIAIGSMTQTEARLSINGKLVQAVTMNQKAEAESIVHLAAAVIVAAQNPALLDGFAESLAKGGGTIIRPLPPVNIPLYYSSLEVMRDALVEARRDGLSDSKGVLAPEEEPHTTPRRHRWELSKEDRAVLSIKLLNEAQIQVDGQQSTESLPGRDSKTSPSLPMSQYSTQVLELISKSHYSVIIGATGSGKTTQVPQIILDDAVMRGEGGYCDIICTQPRRLAASSVAQRVAAERGDQLGQSVGYHVRFDAKPARPGASITYCTTGILLEQLKHDPDLLHRVSHIVLDEVHERDLALDLLVIVLKTAVRARQEAKKAVPKIILMSATMDAAVFCKYFGSEEDGELVPCPMLSVPGRTFPVQERYVHDIISEIKGKHSAEFGHLMSQHPPSTEFVESELAYSGPVSEVPSTVDWARATEKRDALVPIALIAATVAHICNTSSSGGVLVFLPGLQEITATKDLLTAAPIFGQNFCDEQKFKIFMLHSAVPSAEQQAVLKDMPQGCRKIILSTNIAETSITVPDVQYVVDSGKLREKRYDQLRRISQLYCTWEAQSNARQRAGRAGRVQDGYYYALYSEMRRRHMPASGLPELLRSDLQETCLSIKARGFEEPLTSFLDRAIQPPSPAAVELAVQNLQAIDALTGDESLTTLGRILSKLPLHPAMGKMVILGILFRCLDPLLTLSSMSGEQSFFADPPLSRQAAKQAHLQYADPEHPSDHLAFLNAYKYLRRLQADKGWYAAKQTAFGNFLHYGVFKSVAGTTDQIHEVLQSVGLVEKARRGKHSQGLIGGEQLNVNSHNAFLIKCLLTAGFHPHIGAKTTAKAKAYRTPSAWPVLIHPSSQNSSRSRSGETPEMLTYSNLARSTSGDTTFMRDTTAVDPLMVLLFGGKLQTRGSSLIEMDGWLPFRIQAVNPAYATKLVFEFRKALDRMLNRAFAALNFQGRTSIASDPVNERLVRAIVELFERGHAEREVVGRRARGSDVQGRSRD